jgi:hypothetical protein
MVADSIPDEAIIFFSRTMALGSTQPLTEISTRNILRRAKGWPARKADNLTAICELTV